MNPPQCIFVPDGPIFAKMIETVAKHTENKHMLYAKFSDMEHEKPPWMLEDDEKIRLQELQREQMNRDTTIEEEDTSMMQTETDLASGRPG